MTDLCTVVGIGLGTKLPLNRLEITHLASPDQLHGRMAPLPVIAPR